jgi:hypothetical protein
MSLSRSATWTQRPGSPRSSTDCRRLSSQRTLSFRSIGTRVGLTLRLSAAVPLNFARVQTFAAVTPSGTPFSVTARLVCRRRPQRVWCRHRPLAPRPLLTLLVTPIAVVEARWKTNSVVSCSSRITPRHALKRSRVAAKWPPRMSASSTRSLARNR